MTSTSSTDLSALALALLRTDPARAVLIFEQLYASAPDFGGAAQRVDALLGLTSAHVALSQQEHALVKATAALDQARAAGLVDRQIKALQRLGTCYLVLGDFAVSLEHQIEALDLARQADNRSAECIAALNLGMLYSETGRFADALAAYDQALELCEDDGTLHLEGRILNSYCVDCRNLGDYDRALEYGRRSAQIFELTGDRYGQGVALGSIGEAYAAAGRHREAIDALTGALELLRAKSHDLQTVEAVEISYQIGVAYRNLGELAEAEAWLTDALGRAASSHFLNVESQCREMLAALSEQRGDFRAALAHHREHHGLRERLFNEAGDQKLKNLEVLHRTRQALDDAERQRRLREEDRRYFEQLSELQREFFSTATHDLKNPLTAIDLGTRMLERLIPDDCDEAHDVLSQVRRSVGQMHGLVSDFLELARLETGRTLRHRAVGAAQLLERAVSDHRMTAAQKSVELRLQAELDDLLIECDAELVRRALDNLIGNALKYSGANGTVVVSASRSPDAITFRIADTGLGIPPGDLPHLFDRFYRVQRSEHLEREGTGLGLAIVRSIVEQHGGSVSVESELGRGSVFSIELPLSRPGAVLEQPLSRRLASEA